MGDKVMPRPGVKPSIVVEYTLDEPRKLGERGEAALESEINEEFLEPNNMGQLAVTFRSNVAQSGLLAHKVQVRTTTSELDEDIVYRIKNIIEDYASVTVKTWNLYTKIDRKSAAVDFI